MTTRHLLLALGAPALLLTTLNVALAWQGPPQEPRPAAAPAKAGTEANLLPADPVVTQHTVRIGDQTVAYTAEAGWLPIREDGKVVARMFYVAYTRNGIQDLSSRPIVFSFNGGPGTASIWMHLGLHRPQAGDV